MELFSPRSDLALMWTTGLSNAEPKQGICETTHNFQPYYYIVYYYILERIGREKLQEACSINSLIKSLITGYTAASIKEDIKAHIPKPFGQTTFLMGE